MSPTIAGFVPHPTMPVPDLHTGLRLTLAGLFLAPSKRPIKP